MAFRSAQRTHCSVLKPGIFPHIGNKHNAFYFLSFCQSFPPKSSKTFLHLQKGLFHMVAVKNSKNYNPDFEQHSVSAESQPTAEQPPILWWSLCMAIELCEIWYKVNLPRIYSKRTQKAYFKVTRHVPHKRAKNSHVLPLCPLCLQYAKDIKGQWPAGSVTKE